MRKFFITFFIISLSLFLLSCSANQSDTIYELKSYENECIELINEIRKENKLNEVVFDKKAKELSDFKTKDMLTNNYIDHKSMDGKYIDNIADDNNIEYEVICENLYSMILNKNDMASNLDITNSNDIIEQLMQSPSHKKNILNPNVDKIGITVYRYNNQIISTQIFLK